LAEITTEQVIKEQRQQLNNNEFSNLTHIKHQAITKSQNNPNLELHKQEKINHAIDYSIGHLYARSSVLKGNQLLAESLNQGIGYIDLQDLKEQANKNPELVVIRENNKDYLSDDITTLTGMEREIWAVNKIKETKNKCKPANKGYTPFSEKADIEAEKTGSRDYTEHRKVISKILQSKDQYISLRGVAGAGKTTSLRELQNGLNRRVANVTYLSPTTAGVDVLKKEGFTNAVTVENFRLRQDKLNIKNGWIIIDEAGLLSNINGTEIMKIAASNNARILFVGDTKQHKSVAAGDFLRILETHSEIQHLELNKIYRQQHELYNKAATMLAAGDIEGGISLIDNHEAMGWLKEGRGKYKDNAIKDYLKFTDNGRNIDNCIFVSTSNKECNDITLKLRGHLKENKYIDAKNSFEKETFISNNWTAQQKKSAKNYVKGMTILIRQSHGEFKKNEIVEVEGVVKDEFKRNRLNLKDGRYLSYTNYNNFEVGQREKLDLCKGEKIMARMPYNDIANGDIFTVSGRDRHGNITTKEGVVIPKEYKSIKYGYVSTSHKQQGAKAKYVVIAAEYLNKDSIYVATTRGVDECRINVPDKEQLYKQANILTTRQAALDLAKIDKLLEAKKLKITNKEDLIPRKKIWNIIKISAKYIKGKLLNLIKESKNINKIRQELAKNNQLKVTDPFRDIVVSGRSKSRDMEKGIGFDF
ncbi:MAG: AAA family ATPase, partial [Lentisphaerae bacterium]|nr:AAA family ATPase [Lentisphaerota bacterium]